MKLWLISQDTNTGYDTYDSAVVAADDEAQARALHPDGGLKWLGDLGWRYIDRPGEPYPWTESTWTHPANVTAKLVGDALPGAVEGVICASFNAG